MPQQAEGGDGAPTAFDARLAAIVTLSDDALLTVDTNQLVTFLNPAAERILGFAAADLVGQSIEILIPTRHREAHRRHLAHFVSASKPQHSMVLAMTSGD
jgi:PAS domain S-box-containing protein